MSKFISVMLRILASIFALVAMFGILLSIAYYHQLYTPPAGESPPLLAITGATLVDGTGAPPRRNITIVISGNRIWSIEPGHRAPGAATALHVPGWTVIPTLIDTAVYFEAPVGEELDYRTGEWLWETTRSVPDHRRDTTEAGIGMVLDLGSGLDGALNTRSLLRRGELAGPYLMTAGPLLTAPGGCPGNARYPVRAEETTRPVVSGDDARAWVQALAARGVDVISVCYSSYSGQYALMDREVLRAIIQEAHGFDLRVLVETSALIEARQAVAAGADALVGGVTISEQQVDGTLLTLMRQQGTIYIPTLAAVEAQQPSQHVSLSSAILNARLVHQAGIKLLAGSGTAGRDMSYVRSLHRELELLVTAGLTEAQALRAAMIDAAEFLRVEEYGSIAEGQVANLIILDSDPLEDLRALDQVRVVIQAGVVTLNRSD